MSGAQGETASLPELAAGCAPAALSQGGGRATAEFRAYDAGTEATTESCEHVPCEVHGRRKTDGAEGAVGEHQGLRGDADIPPARQWHAPVLGTLTVTRLR